MEKLHLTEKQKKVGLIVVCAWILAWLLVAEVCRASEPAGNGQRVDLALWLARSCVGESGWDSVETGECAAIAWIYHKRSYMLPGRNYFRAMVEYSAAIKPDQRRPWLRRLTRKGDRPRLLETNINWSYHRKKWMETLAFADKFFRGLVPDPTPEAMHFGGVFDEYRMDPQIWEPIDTGFKNTFWKRRDY